MFRFAVILVLVLIVVLFVPVFRRQARQANWKRCSACGAGLPGEAAFCLKCGRPVGDGAGR